MAVEHVPNKTAEANETCQAVRTRSRYTDDLLAIKLMLQTVRQVNLSDAVETGASGDAAKQDSMKPASTGAPARRRLSFRQAQGEEPCASSSC